MLGGLRQCRGALIRFVTTSYSNHTERYKSRKIQSCDPKSLFLLQVINLFEVFPCFNSLGHQIICHFEPRSK